MSYALNLSEDKRILSASVGGNYNGMPIVDTLPEGNLPDYLYVNGVYVYDPLPKPEQPEPAPSLESRVATVESDVASLTAAIEKGLAL